MTAIKPDLLPNSQPVDIESCETASLLNPTHPARVVPEIVASGPDATNSGPDWSLLNLPAA